MSALNSTATLFERLLIGDVVALARAISILETRDDRSDALANRLHGHAGKARVIGFTGPPGSGKSTLINAYVARLRAAGERVAILAVDPSSPLSGGSILGDRTRMGEHNADTGVFIRSIAARGYPGGLALSIPVILDAVDAAGWPTVILETVGAGQSENEIVEFADVKVVLNAPGLGDDIQAIKAGILEIADVLVVNKSDLPLADQTTYQLQAMLELRGSRFQSVSIVKTTAIEHKGLEELDQAITDKLTTTANISPEQRRFQRLPALLRRRVDAMFRARLDSLAPDKVNTICNDVRSGKISIDSAAANLADLAFKVKN